MTEEEWLSSTDPLAMVSSSVMYPFWGDADCAKVARSVRKRKLCCVVWLRTIWDLLVSEHSRRYVEVTEQYLEGEATKEELHDACGMAKDAGEDPGVVTDGQCWATQAAYDIGDLRDSIEWLTLCPEQTRQPMVSATRLADTLRDIFGNPFRPVAVDPAWLTETVTALAEGIYQERAFDRLPILADALEDAGCDHAGILTHCREPSEHVRGCWVVDLLTGRK